jgi:hypothetical protein
MPLTITTKKAAAKPKLKTQPKIAQQPTETEQLADKIIEAYPVIEAAKAPKKESDAARKELLELLEPAHDSKEAIVVQGTKGTVKFGVCADGLQVTDMKRVHQILGDKAFYALAKVGITDLKKYLTMHQLADVTEPCDGSRNMTVLPLQE